MDERREEARDSIRYHVWSGHYDAKEVFNIVDEDVFECDDDDHAWLREAIRREFHKKRKAELDWPEVTSCDQLDRVFRALRRKGILAQHRCGFTQQDGLDVVDDIYKEAGGKRSGLAGYCFYTLQDMEGAMWDDTGLWLAFGSFSRISEDGIQIGGIIRDKFKRAAFDVDWDGTIKSRLLLKGFRWQRRSPEP